MMTSPEWIEHVRAASVIFEADANLFPAGLEDDLLRAAAKRACEGEVVAHLQRVHVQQLEEDQVVVPQSGEVHAASVAVVGDGARQHRSAFLIVTGCGRCLVVMASMWSVAVAVAMARGHQVRLSASGKVLP